MREANTHTSRRSEEGEDQILALLALALLPLLARWLAFGNVLGVPIKNEVGCPLRGAGCRHA